MKTAGVLLRVDGQSHFLPASLVVRLAGAVPIARVPGAPLPVLGVALYERSIVPVLAIGSARREMIICSLAGDLVALVGADVVRAGSFESATEPPGAVVYEGGVAAPLDVAAMCHSLSRATSSDRWRLRRAAGAALL